MPPTREECGLMDAHPGVHAHPLRPRVGSKPAATRPLAERELPSSCREDLGLSSRLASGLSCGKPTPATDETRHEPLHRAGCCFRTCPVMGRQPNGTIVLNIGRRQGRRGGGFHAKSRLQPADEQRPRGLSRASAPLPPCTSAVPTGRRHFGASTPPGPLAGLSGSRIRHKDPVRGASRKQRFAPSGCHAAVRRRNVPGHERAGRALALVPPVQP